MDRYKVIKEGENWIVYDNVKRKNVAITIREEDANFFKKYRESIDRKITEENQKQK